jgi:hypothetical protein
VASRDKGAIRNEKCLAKPAAADRAESFMLFCTGAMTIVMDACSTIST